MAFKLSDLYSGGALGSVPTTKTMLSRKAAADAYKSFEEVGEALIKLIALVRGGDPFYARVTSGCRAGSIVRLDSMQFKVGVPSKPYHHHLINTHVVAPTIVAKLVEEYNKVRNIWFYTNNYILTNVPNGGRVKAEYDGRKPVALTYEEVSSLEYLPDYAGPTVYQFTRTERTPEEREALKSPAQHQVFDKIGEEIKVGDIFFYGEQNAIVIGKLTRIGGTGSLAFTSFVGGDPRRIINDTVRSAVSEGRPVPSLIKFSKDLADKLMIYKLGKL